MSETSSEGVAAQALGVPWHEAFAMRDATPVRVVDTCPLVLEGLLARLERRGWSTVIEVRDVGSVMLDVLGPHDMLPTPWFMALLNSGLVTTERLAVVRRNAVGRAAAVMSSGVAGIVWDVDGKDVFDDRVGLCLNGVSCIPRQVAQAGSSEVRSLKGEERELLAHLASEATTGEIAEMRCCDERTVRRQEAEVYRAIAAEGRRRDVRGMSAQLIDWLP